MSEMSSTLKEVAISRIRELEADNKRLREALKEAVEWNWLDKDLPSDAVIDMIEDALGERWIRQ